MYSLKSKSVSKMHFPRIWRSKFADLANKTVKKTKSSGKMAVDKSAWIKAWKLFFSWFSLISPEKTVFENLGKNPGKLHYQTWITLDIAQQGKYEIHVGWKLLISFFNFYQNHSHLLLKAKYLLPEISIFWKNRQIRFK